ncbi:MAG: hypothetical protein ACXVPR_07065 [Actinomycetota bacterium]
MTPTPPQRDPALRTAAVAFAQGFGIAVLIALIGQAIALVVFVARGASGSYAPYARLGALYDEVFHHVDVGVRVLPVGGARAASVQLGIALLTVTVVSAVLLALFGRRLARRAAGGRVVLSVLVVSLGYAIVPLALGLVARGHVELPSGVPVVRAVDVTVSAVQAFVVPFALAAAALALGALLGLGGREGRPAGDAAIADVVAGGIRSFAMGLALSVVGVLIFASVQPAVARAYGSVVTAPRSLNGKLAVAGHLALLLPNQAVWVLVPAMAGSDDAVLEVRPAGSARPSTRRETAFLSYRVTPTRVPIGPAGVTSPRLQPAPRALLVFLLVPLAATVAGGMRAARDGSTTSARVLLGAGSGLVFAGLAAVAMGLSRVDLGVTGPFLGTSTVRISMGPALIGGTALATVWGVVGGAFGGAIPRRHAAAADAEAPQDDAGTGTSIE